MPRQSYYQEVGNPLQKELLPDRPMTLRFAIADTTDDLSSGHILRVLLIVFAIDTLDTAAHLHYDRTPELVVGIRLLALALISVALLVTFAQHVRSLPLRIIYCSFLLFTAVAAPLSLSTGTATVVAWLHAGLIATGYTTVFAIHWTERCITSPVDRSTADDLRRRWAPLCLVLAGIPVLVIMLAIICSPVFAAVFFVLATIIPPFIARERQGFFVTSAIDSWTSWLTYNLNDRQIPGIFESPAGSATNRTFVTIASCFVISACLRDLYPIPFVLPTFVALVLPLLTMGTVLHEASRYLAAGVPAERWPSLVEQLRRSSNPVERNSYYMARVHSDGSPLIVPRDVFFEHGHFLGDSGAGKTSLGLSPFIEQTIGFGDCSLVCIDLKADSLELLATMVHSAEKLKRDRGIDLPLKYLSTRDDLSSFAFNPQTQPFWSRFNSFKRTDLLTGATGLNYGADFGAAFYSAANASVLNHTYKLYPCVETFEELAERCGHVLVSANRKELHPEMRRNGSHVHEILKRLASFLPLNVTTESGFSSEVIDHAIDLADMFRRPQMLYCHLSSTLGPGSAPALARFVVFFLLACATTAERRVPVFLVIDEFQRMVAQNFEYMLQLARSMNVGIILANQSLQDLETPTANLIPTIEANCRYRQWFSVSSLDDRRWLSESSGETVEYFTSRSESTRHDGNSSSSVSVTEHVMPRLSTNDIALASDHPKRSIVRISRGAGYAQYGGLPFVVESDFHISKSEYERRRRMRWPDREPGTFIPDEWTDRRPPKEPTGPIVTTEVIGESEDDDPFRKLLADLDEPKESKPKRGRRRK